MGDSRGPGLNARTHLGNMHRLRYSEAVPGKHRRCHFIPSRSHMSRQALPRRPTICWLCDGLVVAIGGQKLGVNAGANVTTPPSHAAGEKGIVAPPEPGADKQRV